MHNLLLSLLTTFFSSLRSRAALRLEILALRHQLGILQRSVKRPKLTNADRFFWIGLSRSWVDWRSALILVKPETVIGWHRKAFRLFWTSKIRRGQRGHQLCLIPICHEAETEVD